MQLRLIQRQAAGHSGATRPEAPCSARAEDSPVERRGWQRRDLGPADLPAVVVFVVAVQLRAASRSRCAGLGHLLRSAIVAAAASSANGREDTHSAPWKRAAKGGDRAGLTPWKGTAKGSDRAALRRGNAAKGGDRARGRHSHGRRRSRMYCSRQLSGGWDLPSRPISVFRLGTSPFPHEFSPMPRALLLPPRLFPCTAPYTLLPPLPLPTWRRAYMHEEHLLQWEWRRDHAPRHHHLV